MKTWQEDLLEQTEGATCEHELFDKIANATQALFEHCAYGLCAYPCYCRNPIPPRKTITPGPGGSSMRTEATC